MGIAQKIKYGLIGTGLIWSATLPLIFLYITINTFALTGHNDINIRFVWVYGIGGLICTIMSGFNALIDWVNVFRIKKNNKAQPLGFLFTSQEANYRPASKFVFLRYGLSIFFAFIVAFALIGSDGLIQGWVTPSPYTAEHTASAQLSTADKAIHMSFEPSFVEDYIFLMLSSVFLALFNLVFFIIWKFKITKRFIDIRAGPGTFMLFCAFACLLASSGYGAAMGGFASTHEAAQGDNPYFYLQATIFGWVNLMIYQATGFFMPIAHFVNNFIVSFSLAIGLAIAGTVAGQYLLHVRKQDIEVIK